MTGFLKTIESPPGQTIGLIRENGQVEDCAVVDPADVAGAATALRARFGVSPAQLVTFHRRESKPIFWALYARREMSVDELIEDSDCLGGLKRTSRAPQPVKASLVYEYEFNPDQDTCFRPMDSCFILPDGRERARGHG